MANIYAFLLEKCRSKYTVAYTLKPTYLQSIIGEENNSKIVLVYVEERKNTSSLSPDLSSNLPTKKSTSNDLDLTGSPLKDDCMIDDIDLSFDLKTSTSNPWRMEEESHRGISVEKIRELLCSERFQTENSNTDTRCSVWVLCNGSDYDRTMFLEYEFLPGFISRGVVKFTGLTLLTEINSVQPLLQKHFTGIRSESKLETYIENSYQIKSDIMIRCSWSTSAALPALIDLISCDVILSQTFRLRDCTLTQCLINQLRILTCIREDIVAHKDLEGNDLVQEPLYRCGCGIEKDELRESINKVMTEVSGFADNETGTEIESDLEAVVQTSEVRRLSDLTDKLWDILKRCSSYKDLKTAFQLVFQCAARFNIVNMPTNKNHLAEIIAEVSNRRLAVPCLTGTEPLELLLEIGLEKLYKDYAFIFMRSKMCSPNRLKNSNSLNDCKVGQGNTLSSVRKSLHNAIAKQDCNTATPRKTLLHNVNGKVLKSFDEEIGFKNSYFDENTTAMQISKLLQIHCTLEHLLMIQINLNLQNAYSDICEQLLSRPLTSYNKNIDESFTDQINISIPAHYVREHLEGKAPYARRITFKSSNKFRSCKTSFFYSIENVCPPGISDNIQNSEKEVIKDCVYYSWVYQKIQTLKE